MNEIIDYLQQFIGDAAVYVVLISFFIILVIFILSYSKYYTSQQVLITAEIDLVFSVGKLKK